MAFLRAADTWTERRLLAAMLAGVLLSVSCAAPGGQPDPGPPAPEQETSPSTRPTPPELSRSQSRPPTTSTNRRPTTSRSRVRHRGQLQDVGLAERPHEGGLHNVSSELKGDCWGTA